MRYIPFELLEEIPGREERFWCLIKENERFYKLNRAYNTISKSLCETEDCGGCDLPFCTQDLRKERLWIKDEIFGYLNH